MRQGILESLRGQVLLADGGLGTELQRRGLEPGGCGELWNVSHPEIVGEVHRAFIGAGARLITTNSFRGNRLALSLYGLESRVAELNRAAGKIAREIAGEDFWVLGSVGPFGGFLEPVGDASAADALAAFREQAEALLESDVDAIIVETMSAVEEMELAIQGARQAGVSLVIATMTFAKTRAGYRTMMGVSVEQAAEAMDRAGADIIGSNCGTDLTVADYAAIVRQLRASSWKPIIAQPNAGRPELVGGQVVYKQTPEVMADEIESLIRAGANIVGGCCGTTPEHIRLFAEKLRCDKIAP